MNKRNENKNRRIKLQVGERGLLGDLKKNQKAVILNMKKKMPLFRRHLLDMGLVQGTKIQIKKMAPLGDPIVIALRDYELCLRKEEIQFIEIEVIA